VGEHNYDITAGKWLGTLSVRRDLRLYFSLSPIPCTASVPTEALKLNNYRSNYVLNGC
jgi:hypothetical protein